MTSCYLVLAMSRTQVGADAFLSWGRYHYFPILFMTIMFGNMMPSVKEILRKIYSPKRFTVFLWIILIIFFINHIMLIYQKSFSSIRLEG